MSTPLFWDVTRELRPIGSVGHRAGSRQGFWMDKMDRNGYETSKNRCFRVVSQLPSFDLAQAIPAMPRSCGADV